VEVIEDCDVLPKSIRVTPYDKGKPMVKLRVRSAGEKMLLSGKIGAGFCVWTGFENSMLHNIAHEHALQMLHVLGMPRDTLALKLEAKSPQHMLGVSVSAIMTTMSKGSRKAMRWMVAVCEDQCVHF